MKKGVKVLTILIIAIILIAGFWGGVTAYQLNRLSTVIPSAAGLWEDYNAIRLRDCSNFDYYEQKSRELISAILPVCRNPLGKMILASRKQEFEYFRTNVIGTESASPSNFGELCTQFTSIDYEEEFEMRLQELENDCA